MESNERLFNIVEQNVFISYFLLGLILLAWVIVLDRKTIGLYVTAFLGSRYSDQLERAEFSNTNRLSIVSKLFYFLNITMILYRVQRNGIINILEFEGITLFVVTLLLVVFWYAVKAIVVLLIGIVFSTIELAKENIFYNQINSVTLGLLLFPLLLVSHFQVFVDDSLFIWLSVFLLILGSFFRNKRLSVISFSRFGIPVYYNILYICTLEILPLVVLMKLLVGKM